MMSGPDLSNLNHYQVWGIAVVLSQAATEATNSFRVQKCNSVDLVCFTEKNPLTTLWVKDHRKRLQACVSANDGHFEHLMWQFIYKTLTVTVIFP